MSRGPAELYLDLLVQTLSGELCPEPPLSLGRLAERWGRHPRLRGLVQATSRALERLGVEVALHQPDGEALRAEGRTWPAHALTMVGRRRLESLRACVEQALDEGVPGDFVETGVWRGGCVLLMRAVLAARGVTDRRVFAADSFAGLPAPDAARYPRDAGNTLHAVPVLAVPRAEVAANLARFGLLDEQVVFLEGWFRDTLPRAPIERLALMRLDGDLYESTLDALRHLYDKLSPGGFCVIDDYVLEGCRSAVDEFRRARAITSPLVRIDWTGVLWRKEAGERARP